MSAALQTGALLAGVIALTAGADLLVRGASRLAAAWKVSPATIGLTLVAAGTSLPELVVSGLASLRGEGNLAAANVTGSNIANIGLILGLAALMRPVQVALRLLRREIPLLLGITVLLWGLVRRPALDRWAGLILLAAAGLLLLSVWRSTQRAGEEAGDRFSPELARPSRRPVLDLLSVAAGIVLLAGGAHLMVQGAVALAALWGVSERVIGLTIVAVGTSLPELATTAVAAWRGEGDLALGNVLGSNIFNTLVILGIAASIREIPVHQEFRAFDAPVMLAFAAVLLPLALTQRRISRWEGALLLGGYTLYMGTVVALRECG